MHTKQTRPDYLGSLLRSCECGKYAVTAKEARCALCERKRRRKMFGNTRCHNCDSKNPNAKKGERFCQEECQLEYQLLKATGVDPDAVGLSLVPWTPARRNR